jgi:carbamoyl-phosphate synthase small subunit
MTNRTAKLALEDGTVFTGRAYGADGEKSGEVVFNTALSGYQEVLTDPSYRGQIVTMTYPHIGTYGVNDEDVEGAHPWVEGFVAREFSRVSSNFRASMRLDEYFAAHRIVAIDDIDTRALTRRLRIEGSMNGVLSTVDLDDKRLVAKAKALPKMAGLDLVKFVTGKEPRHWREFLQAKGTDAPPPRYRVALVDCGVKWNIVRLLAQSACDVTVYPATAPAEALLREKFDGVCLSNGPGDPAAVTYAIECVKGLLRKETPVFGICLGHQILGLALGGKTVKLKFGHHGANHPVKRLSDGRVEITSQNHGFAVEEASLEAAGAEATHRNLNDGTCEGLRHRSLPCFSVQYHPEASPGPHDSRYLFERFTRAMEAKRSQKSGA